MTRDAALASCVLALALAAGCSDPGTTPGTDTGMVGIDSGGGGIDTGVPRPDTGVPGTDTGVPGTDTGVPGTDTGTPGTDTGVVVDDSGIDAAASTDDAGTDAATLADANTRFPDGAIMCLAGVECTNWQAAIDAAARGAAGGTVAQAQANCVVQVHQSDCCGARRAYGVNHGSRMDLCTAEAACRSMYTTPAGCSNQAITTDTGETTMNAMQVRVRAVNPMPCSFGTCYTCETFVCMGATCATLGGITPTQCGP